MTVSAVAFPYSKPDPAFHQSGMEPVSPGLGIYYGNGTPDGDKDPWLSAPKGTLYMALNNTDDTGCVYVKVDEGGDDNDWVLLAMAGTGTIVNADVATAAAIVGSKLATNARRHFARSKTFNIDNGSGTTDDDVILVPSDGITIVAVRAVYVEATNTAGADGANFVVGTTLSDNDICAATALQVSKAVGSYTVATVVSGAVAANGGIFVRHTGIAVTEPGQYYVQIEFTVDD